MVLIFKFKMHLVIFNDLIPKFLFQESSFRFYYCSFSDMNK